MAARRPIVGNLPEHLAVLLAERERRRAAQQIAPDVETRVAAMLADVHPEALAGIADKAALVAICGTRRSGKSRSGIRRLAADAATIRDGRVIYLNETLGECENIAWIGNGRDGLLTLNDEYQLGGKPNHSKHTLTFPSGGIVRLVGADDLRQVNKLRGIAPHTVLLDEAQKFPHISTLIKQSLGPAMMDYGGQIIMQGTPGVDLDGLFFEVTRDDDEPPLAGWSVHRLNVMSNPFFGKTPEERFERTVVKYCKEHGLTLDSPEVQREWFGRWVKTDARFVFAVHQVPEHDLCYAPVRELPDGRPDIPTALADLPRLPKGAEWHYTLGCDLGYSPDPFAYVLWAWSWEHQQLYEVCSWSMNKLDSDEQLAILEWVAGQARPDIVVGDIGGAATPIGKGWTKRWQERFGYGMVEAEKSRKFEHIQLLNTDIRQGRVKYRLNSALHRQAKTVIWLPRSGTGALRENPRYPNDVTDAGLYGSRHTFSHLAQVRPEKPAANTPEYWRHLEQQLEDDDDEQESHSGEASYYA